MRFIFILSMFFLVVGLFAVVIGIKSNNFLLLGMGNFLIIGSLFFEMIMRRDDINELRISQNRRLKE